MTDFVSVKHCGQTASLQSRSQRPGYIYTPKINPLKFVLVFICEYFLLRTTAQSAKLVISSAEPSVRLLHAGTVLR